MRLVVRVTCRQAEVPPSDVSTLTATDRDAEDADGLVYSMPQAGQYFPAALGACTTQNTALSLPAFTE